MARSFASVLEQDFPAADREIIVVDDGSTDRTMEIVKKFEPRRDCCAKKMAGKLRRSMRAFQNAGGEIIAFLDGDDWWAPGKLQAVASALASDAALYPPGMIPFEPERGHG